MSTIKLFETKQIRSVWDKERESWFFSIVDVVAVLTDSPNPRKYWSVLKTRLKKEGSELTTNCSQLKMQSADGNETVTNCHGLKMQAIYGKMNLTDVVDTEQLLGGTIAGNTRKEIEEKTGKPVVSEKNTKPLK